MKSAVAILAAGRGSRYEGPEWKLRVDLHGRALVSWAFSAIAGLSVVGKAVVVGVDRLDDLVPAGVEVLVNPSIDDGLAASLQCALRWALTLEVEALCVGLGDQPGVGAEAWSRVLEAGVCDLAVATYDGVYGNPVRIAASLFDRLPLVGEVGARVLFDDPTLCISRIPCSGLAYDLDTVADREWLRRTLRRNEGSVNGNN
ncbi:MAG: nucleotidyltransferase family protein [Ferrimicrobium sp.]